MFEPGYLDKNEEFRRVNTDNLDSVAKEPIGNFRVIYPKRTRF